MQLASAERQAEPLSTVTDSDGHFQFLPLRAGTYVITVNLKGFKPFAKKIVLPEAVLRIEIIHLAEETALLVNMFKSSESQRIA